MGENIGGISGGPGNSPAWDDRADPMEERGFFQRIADRLFGYDFFISYCWADGRHYAVELQRQLEAHGFNCFLDSSDYAKGDNWRAAGKRALKKTSRLILVGTPHAVLSEPVANELRIFSGLKRRVFPIDFGGALAGIGSAEGIFQYLDPDMLRVIEAENALVAGPSEEVLSQIHGSFNLLRQDQKRVRWFAMLTAVFAMVAVVAVVATFIARSETRRANKAAEAEAQRTIESRENSSQSDLNLARGAIDAGWSNDALHRLWDAYDHAPEGNWRRDSARRLMRGWLPAASHVVRPSAMGRDVVIAPDGRRILFLGAARTAGDETTRNGKLVDTANGKVVVELEGLMPSHMWHNPSLTSFSPDGALLACLRPENRLEIFDSHTGELLNTIVLPAPVRAFAIRNRRQFAALYGNQSGVVLHDLQDGRQLFTLPLAREVEDSHGDMVAISGDGKTLVASIGGMTGHWDIDSQRPLPLMGSAGDNFFVNSELISINRDASLIVTIDEVVGEPRAWFTETGEESWAPPAMEHGYFSTDLVAFHPTDPGLAAVGFNDAVEIRRLDRQNEGNSPRRALARFVSEGILTAVAFSNDGRFLITSDDSPGIQITALPPVDRKFNYAGGNGSMKRSADARFGIRNAADAIHLLELETGNPLGPAIQFLASKQAELQALEVAKDRQRAVVVEQVYNGQGNPSLLTIFDPRSSQAVHAEKVLLPAVPDRVFFSPDGSRVLAAIRERNEILTWDSETGGSLPVITTDFESTENSWLASSAISFSESGNRFVQGGGNKVLIRDFEDGVAKMTGAIRLENQQVVSHATMSADGGRIAVVTKSPGGTVTIWDSAGDLVSGPIRAEDDSYNINIDLNRDGTRLALSAGGDLSFHDASTGRRTVGPLRHPNAITEIRFNPDGTAVAVASFVQDEGVLFTDVRLWDVQTGIVLGPMVRRSHEVGIAFAEDGSQLFLLHPHGQDPIERWADFSPIPDDPERIRLTLELMTGWSFGDRGVRLPLSAPATEQRWRKLTELGGAVAQIPMLPGRKKLLTEAPPPKVASQLPQPVPVEVSAPVAEVDADPLQGFLLRWIAAGNSGGDASISQAEFYAAMSQIDGKLMPREDLVDAQRGFEEAFPGRVFTYLDHEVLASQPGQSVTLSVGQHVLLTAVDGSERELEVRDELVLRSVGSELKIASRRRIDTQKIR